MRILVLQLARFGDIYQTWPALKALRRQYPSAHISLMVREKFKAATVGLIEVNEVVVLDTAKILAPILFQANGIDGSLSKLSDMLDKFAGVEFDRIVNLSFSPFASYLTDALSTSSTVVTGYTRDRDGFLAIPDDASAYFYAQAGNDRWSRVHLTNLFALIAGVELSAEDWQVHDLPPVDLPLQQPYIVLQPGASQSEKTLAPTQWQNIVRTVLHETKYDVVILGAKEESHAFSWPQDGRAINLMGKSSLHESMSIIRQGLAFIGPDSVGLHMASLVGTPTLNISVGPVRFWETGPRARGSRVLRFTDIAQFSLSQFLREFISFMSGGETHAAYCLREEGGVAYTGPSEDAAFEFQWRLTQALYMHCDYPMTDDRLLLAAFSRIAELAELGLDQIQGARNENSRSIALSILSEVDHLLHKVCEFERRVEPLANWFLTQKLRIGPGSFAMVLEQTQQCFADLQTITRVYALPVEWDETLTRRDLTWKP